MTKKSTAVTTLKFTKKGREPIYGFADYPKVGKWSESRRPVICMSGWHVSTRNNLSYIINTELWVVKVDGKHVNDGELNYKEAWEKILFVRQVKTFDLVEYAKLCAEHVAHLNNYWSRAAAAYAAYAADAYAADAYAANASAAAAADAYAADAAAAAAERKWQADQLWRIAGLE